MSNRDDEGYFRMRAEHEREMVARSEDSAVALVHLQMASEYERRVQAVRLSVIGKGAGRPIPAVAPTDRGAGTTR